MSQLGVYIYSRPLGLVIVFIFLVVIAWGFLGAAIELHGKNPFIWRGISYIVTIVSIISIIYMTILSRTPTDVGEVHLIPLHSLVLGEKQAELFRTMLMNVLLFVPLGLGVTYTFHLSINKVVAYSIIFSFILSITIEFLQYILRLGCAEVDDILCNTLGGAIGTLSYCLTIRIERRGKNTS